EDKRTVAADGKAILERKLRQLKIHFNETNLNKIISFYKLPSSQELYYQVALEQIDLKRLKNLKKEQGKLKYRVTKKPKQVTLEQLVSQSRGDSKNMLVLGDNRESLDYTLSPCCQPIPGDDVFGFVTINDGIKIHRVNCPNAIQLMSNYAYRVVKAKWVNQESIAFLCGVQITGIDSQGLVNELTEIISNNMHVNMRSISFDTDDGIFEGTIMMYVHDTTHLKALTKKLLKVAGVERVNRIETG
ncbi:MAG: ACT domain-containing protein, partial [Bacteroidota bacterium]